MTATHPIRHTLLQLSAVVAVVRLLLVVRLLIQVQVISLPVEASGTA